MISRRILIAAAGAIAASAAAARAQTAMPRIGLLSVGTDPDKPNPVWMAFLKGLDALGYTEGRNIAIERAFAGGKHERLPELLAGLAVRHVDVVGAAGETENIEAKKALPTTSIVMLFMPDPVAAGLVANLAHPGGTVTGLTTQAPDTDAKRLQLLKDALPQLAYVGLLMNPEAAVAKTTLATTEKAAAQLAVRLQPLPMRSPDDLPGAFDSASRAHLDALVVMTDGLTFNQRGHIAELAIAAHLPLIGELRNFADAGALMAYGPRFADLARRAAGYVDRILRGAKPAELPVEQPTVFELVVNLKTANALRLTLPQAVLLRADSVIE